MINNEKKEWIKEILDKNYDMNLIAVELDIPFEEILEIKRELDREISFKIAERKNKVKSYETLSRMEDIRAKYFQLYYKNNNPIKEDIKTPSEEDINLINTVTENIKKIVIDLNQADYKEKFSLVQDIILELRKVEQIPFTFDQAENLNEIMNSDALKVANEIDHKFVRNTFFKYKSIVAKKFVDAIELASYQTTDLDRLKDLKSKLPNQSKLQNSLLVNPLKSRIESKINRIITENAVYNFNNNCSSNVSQMATMLANGEVDLEKANQLISSEIKSTSQNRNVGMHLTEKQQKENVFMKIRTMIKQKSEEYPIKDSEKTMEQIKMLMGCDTYTSLDCVIENYIFRKKFEEAKELCKKYLYSNDLVFAKNIDRLHKKIIHSEISNIILKGIKLKGTPKEENAYIELIENGLNRANINPKMIELGKSEDGQKTITLADIWDERVR